MALQELKARQDVLAKEIKSLGAKRSDWNDSDKSKFTNISREYRQNKVAIREQAAIDETLGGGSDRDNLGRDKGNMGGRRVDGQGRTVGYFEDSDESVELNFSDTKGTTRQSYKQAKRQNRKVLQSSGYKPLGNDAEFKSPGDFIKSGLNGHTNQVFKDRVAKHFEPLRKHAENRFGSKSSAEYKNAVTGMSEGVGTDGGWLLVPDMATGIIDRIYENDLWSRTDNYTVTGNAMTFIANAETSRANGSRHGGLRGYWLGEGATKTPSKPTFRSITLKLVKLAVVVYLTDELLEDTGNVLVEYVTRKAAEEFNFMLGDALINGTGVGQPLGVLNWPSLIAVSAEAGQLADTIETENIVKMFSRFWAPNRKNMVWLHNQDIEPELFTMTIGVGTGGEVTYMPPGRLADAPYATLMGRPVMPTEFNPTLGDVGDILAVDLGQMLSISKGGIAQATSIHVEFLTDQTALRFVMRCNAGPWESSVISPYKGTLTQSNAVALAAR